MKICSPRSLQGAILFSLLTVSVGFAQDLELDTEEKKQSYAIGTIIGTQMQQQFSQDPSLDLSILASAISAALNNNSQVTLTEAQQLVDAYQRKVQEKLLAEAEDSKSEGEEYRAANR